MRTSDIQSINWNSKVLVITEKPYQFTLQQRQIHGRRYIYAHSRINGKVSNIYLGKAGEQWRDGTILK